MGTFTAGADPDDLDRLAVAVDRAGDHVRSIQRSLNGRINSSPWHGRNADRFRDAWSGEHRRAIDDAVRFLEDGSTALRRHAEEQRRVSAVGAPVTSRSGLGLDASRLVNTGFDLFDIATGASPTPAGFGISIGLGLWDLVFDRDGYGGRYRGLESAMDVLGIIAAGVGIAGLVVGGVAAGAVSAPVIAAIVGGAAIAGGLIKLADLILETQTGRSALDGTVQVVGSHWRQSAQWLDSNWSMVAA